MKLIKKVFLMIALLGIFSVSVVAYQGTTSTTMSSREYKDYPSYAAESILTARENCANACVGIEGSEWVCDTNNTGRRSQYKLSISTSVYTKHMHSQCTPNTNNYYDIKYYWSK